MARKRMIAPDFWTDEKLGQCKREERLFFMGLISNADDEGRGRGNIKLLKANIFPYDDDLKVKDIEQMACSLMDKGMAYFYVIDGQDFYCLPNFLKHQTINKARNSNLPDIPINQEEVLLPYYYRTTTVLLPPKRKEENIKEKNIVFFLDVINYLNDKAGTGYKPDSKPTMQHINARLSEGYTLDDFKKVIDKKCAEWKGTDQEKYLRPETLFGTKFEGYLNQKVTTKSKPPTKARAPSTPSETPSAASVLNGGEYKIYDRDKED